MQIQISESAAKKASEILEENQKNPSEKAEGFRLYLAGKSCDGFQYGICLSDSLENDHKMPISEKKRIFLFVDQDTMPFVERCQIDYVEDDRGAGFLIENPDQKKFRGKFFKRKAWVDRLTAKQSEKIAD